MSIVMVGPYPGPFDRTHYSDSSSDSQGDRHHWRPRPTAPPQPQPRSRTATPERSSELASRESVTDRPSQSDSASAPRPVYNPPTYPETPHSQQPPQSSPKSRIAAIKRRCCELLSHLGAFALLAAVAAVLMFAAAISPGKVHPEEAPLQGANVFSDASDARGSDTASPSRSSPATAEEEKRPGHSAVHVNRVPKAKPRRHRGGGRDIKWLPMTSPTPQKTQPTTSDGTARSRPTLKATSSAGDDREARSAARKQADPTSPSG